MFFITPRTRYITPWYSLINQGSITSSGLCVTVIIQNARNELSEYHLVVAHHTAALMLPALASLLVKYCWTKQPLPRTTTIASIVCLGLNLALLGVVNLNRQEICFFNDTVSSVGIIQRCNLMYIKTCVATSHVYNKLAHTHTYFYKLRSLYPSSTPSTYHNWMHSTGTHIRCVTTFAMFAIFSGKGLNCSLHYRDGMSTRLSCRNIYSHTRETHRRPSLDIGEFTYFNPASKKTLERTHCFYVLSSNGKGSCCFSRRQISKSDDSESGILLADEPQETKSLRYEEFIEDVDSLLRFIAVESISPNVSFSQGGTLLHVLAEKELPTLCTFVLTQTLFVQKYISNHGHNVANSSDSHVSNSVK